MDKDIFKMCKVLSALTGIDRWEQTNMANLKGVMCKILLLGLQLFFLQYIPGLMAELFHIGADFRTVISITKLICFIGVVTIKLLIVQSTKVSNLMRLLLDENVIMVSTKDPIVRKIYKEHSKSCFIFAVVNMTLVYLGGSTYFYNGVHGAYVFYQTHLNFTDATPKPHPLPVWFPFDKNKYYKTALMYELIFIAQTVIYDMPMQVVVNTVMIFIKAQLKLLQYKVKSIKVKESHNTLKSYVLKHLELMRWIDDFNASFRYILLLEYCVTSVQIATIIFEVLQGNQILFNTFFALLTIAHFMSLAWNANEIILESSYGLSRALYESQWYNMDDLSKQAVHIMSSRCLRPLNIQIGPFGCMDLDAGVSRLKLAYTVVSVLYTTME